MPTTLHHSAFERRFGVPVLLEASAPGRVNLLGEHTDYNDGFVLPTAIPQQTTVRLALSPDGMHHFYSSELHQQVDLPRQVDQAPVGFARYVLGCIRVFEQEGEALPGLSLAIHSRVPLGSGLSSSAALEVAVLRALRQLTGRPLDDVRLAILAQQAEHQYAGVACGIMDQLASSLADTTHMLFLDTRSLERRLLPLPAHSQLVVIDSGVPRTLATSGYNTRRAECEQAAASLGISSLREATLDAVASLPELLQKRARHVVTENQRVLDALESRDPEHFGQLMNASHASLRDDYEVSVPELDRLVNLLQEQEGVFGARLTGAGFGGACVALVRQAGWRESIEAVLEKARHLGGRPVLLVPVAP